MEKKSLMVVGLSGNRALRGVERVVYESLAQLAEGELREHFEKIDLLCGSWQDYYFDLRDKGINIIDAPCNSGLFSRHLFMWLRLRNFAKKYDVVHIMNTMPFLGLGKAKVVVTIHDVAEFARPDKYSYVQSLYRRLVTRVATRLADRVVTVSDFSRKEIWKYLKVTASVVSNGLDHFYSSSMSEVASSISFLSVNGVEVTFDLKEVSYALYFGVIEKTKGLDIALDAFDRAKKSGRIDEHVRFFVAGAPGNLFESLGKYLSRSDIVFTGRIDDAQLRSLIAYSSAVVFLSEYEGFGFPAPEAVVLGAKVIVPEGSVFQEICGRFCYPTSLTDESVLDATLASVLKKPRDWTIEDAQHVLFERYSWRSASQGLLDVYQNA